MSALFATLPQPIHTPQIEDVDEEEQSTTATKNNNNNLSQSTSNLTLTTTSVPPYGSRKSWRPKTQQDFQDGGAYPECPVAQFPLEMGRKTKVSSNVDLLFYFYLYY